MHDSPESEEVADPASTLADQPQSAESTPRPPPIPPHLPIPISCLEEHYTSYESGRIIRQLVIRADIIPSQTELYVHIAPGSIEWGADVPRYACRDRACPKFGQHLETRKKLKKHLAEDFHLPRHLESPPQVQPGIIRYGDNTEMLIEVDLFDKWYNDANFFDLMPQPLRYVAPGAPELAVTLEEKRREVGEWMDPSIAIDRHLREEGEATKMAQPNWESWEDASNVHEMDNTVAAGPPASTGVSDAS